MEKGARQGNFLSMINSSLELKNQNELAPRGRLIHFDYSIPTRSLSYTEQVAIGTF